MSDKQRVMDAVRRMSETATLSEISESVAILAAIRRGEADAIAARGPVRMRLRVHSKP